MQAHYAFPRGEATNATLEQTLVLLACLQA